MFEWLALGSIGFFITAAIVCGLIIAAVEYNRWGLATLCLVATFALLAFFGDFNVWKFSFQHPLEASVTIVGYFASGALWSIAKWWFFVRRQRDKYNDVRDRYMEFLGLPADSPIPEDRKVGFVNRLGALRERPRAREHKSKIMTWMAFWPFSMIWTMISDPVKRTFKWLYRRLQGVFERISVRIYRDVENDMPQPVRRPEPEVDG